ncbi:GNAT family protein [Geitlerinema splendidum]|nr:GNAT family protein [Geitlerinema splendidum]
MSLSGYGIQIEPLDVSHAPGFIHAYRQDPDTFRYFPEKPRSTDLSDIEDFIRLRTRAGFAAHAVLFDGEFVGSSSYMDIRPEHRGLEIGHTWHCATVRGTMVYPAVKLLMLDQAIYEWEAIRVQFKTDLRNLASQNAMKKAGFTCEGVHRNHMIMPDEFIRDTIYFSVLPDEYESIRAGLLKMIETRPTPAL